MKWKDKRKKPKGRFYVSESRYYLAGAKELEDGIISWFDIFQPSFPKKFYHPSIFGFFRWTQKRVS